MANSYHTHSTTLFLTALLLTTLHAPLLVLGQPAVPRSRGLTTVGRLCCTATGNCNPGSRPLVRVPVVLDCNRILGINGRLGVTNTSGFFSITALGTRSLPRGQYPHFCSVTVQLPPRQAYCRYLAATNGSYLISRLQYINTARLPSGYYVDNSRIVQWIRV